MAAQAQPIIAQTHSLLEIDQELDALFDAMQEELELSGAISDESKERFIEFVAAFGDKVDRIGRFLRIQEAIADYAKKESERLAVRARIATRKVEQTKDMLLYFMNVRGLKKIEGRSFTLRQQKNGQDSVRILNEEAIPIAFKRVDARIDGTLWELLVTLVPDEQRPTLLESAKGLTVVNEAIKQAVSDQTAVPGAEVYRGSHIRIA
jgi:hypothetical protein